MEIGLGALAAWGSVGWVNVSDGQPAVKPQQHVAQKDAVRFRV